ncbi:adenine deaminase [Bacillus sp. ISL-47]|uniref:adenine deaminase n=1 Tax=Bacillus sp. ISL-47 TaxID=2819130 RepID=UPI001BE864CF|nr:adenine deaminase [Bacillus sp. ISL-47]MBT2689606.1 adenine deaminase [Bacillus sp. ISL-47]MBT2708425.1 adenine deaminase [Pseudomonas sp. ISL-84]
MELTLDVLKRRIDVAAKRTPADTVIKNGRVINVFTREILQEDIAIVDGYIAGLGNYEGKQTIDAAGSYIAPGFIDGHVHIESAMVTPAEFSNVVIPHGVTTVIADPHEIANVSGLAGIDFMLKASENIPLDVFFMLPSCVPATPFENAGAELSDTDLKDLYAHPRVIGLGEVMDYPAVMQNHEGMLKKLEGASSKGHYIDGHAAGLNADGINVYMSAGIRTDHECINAEEALVRLRRGMHVMLREGSAARDLIALLKAVNEQNARRCLFVTDDKHLDDIMNEGSIDHNVRMAINEGVDPILAIQMATLNAAECFGLKHKGAIAPGYEADLLFLSDLNTINIEKVMKSGKLAAEGGTIKHPARSNMAPAPPIIDSVKINRISYDDLKIWIGTGDAHIIGIIPNSIVTKHLVEKPDNLNGFFQPNPEKDYLKLVVLERHKNSGNLGLGIVKGLGINRGAIASTVAHDSHNIVAAGTSDEDLLLAIEHTAKMKGGLAIIQDGKVLADIALPIAGLMTDQDSAFISKRLSELNQALLTIGCSMQFNPFLTLSFLALPVIPELKLTDKGLFSVKTFRHISVAEQTLH